MNVKYNNQKGITILELMVAMTIFVVVITLAVGGFVSILRLQMQAESMTDVQQNARIAMETVTRMARQAESLTTDHESVPPIHSDHSAPNMNYKDTLKITTDGTPICFKIVTASLKKFNGDCTTGELTLTSDEVKVTKFYFDKTPGVPSKLTINITVKSVAAAPSMLSNEINLSTSVLLTGLK